MSLAAQARPLRHLMLCPADTISAIRVVAIIVVIPRCIDRPRVIFLPEDRAQMRVKLLLLRNDQPPINDSSVCCVRRHRQRQTLLSQRQTFCNSSAPNLKSRSYARTQFYSAAGGGEPARSIKLCTCTVSADIVPVMPVQRAFLSASGAPPLPRRSRAHGARLVPLRFTSVYKPSRQSPHDITAAQR
jgi:hypothetical protein